MAEASSKAVFQDPEHGAHVSAANAKFALDLYKLQASATDANIFFSPLSISVALAMTHLGAGGRTKSQLDDVLHFSDEEHEERLIHEALGVDFPPYLDRSHTCDFIARFCCAATLSQLHAASLSRKQTKQTWLITIFLIVV